MQNQRETTTTTAPEVQVFDHVIVGVGQAAGVLLRGLPEHDSIAVIEGHYVGGSCVNYGCTPTKTLVATAKVAHQARRAHEYGVQTGPVRIDFAAVRERMNALRYDVRDSLATSIEEQENATLFRGWASFEAPRTLRVGDTIIRGEHVYLDVGSTARTPDIEGLESVAWLDNVRLLDLADRPDHLVIVGGSYLGVEFAQIFVRLGSRVTLLTRGPRVASREDDDIADAVRDVLERDGVVVETNARVERVGLGDGGGVDVYFERDAGEGRVSGTHLLLATGRVPNTERLALSAAGVDTDDDGAIVVDDLLRTSAEGVFAMGDVAGGAFTHTAVNDGEIVLDALSGGPRRRSQRIPIYAMFTDPPLGRVGLSEREALAAGHRVERATLPMSSFARAREMGETTGFAKLLVDAETDMILGAAVLGVHGDEVANMLAAFMATGRSWRTFRRTVLIHPTVGEMMPWLLDALEAVDANT
ncbi:FAD-containing oxidoreductase [soil metagenome]